MDLLQIIAVMVTAVIILTIKVYFNRKKQHKISSYLSEMSCSDCGSNQLYVDTRSMPKYLNDAFNISCFECGSTWKASYNKI